MIFTDGSQATFTAGKESDGIQLVKDFDFRMEKLKIGAEFGNQIDLERIDMSKSPHWLPAHHTSLEWVGLTQDEQGHYLKQAIRFDFGDHKVDVALGIEGLAVIVEEEED